MAPCARVAGHQLASRQGDGDRHRSPRGRLVSTVEVRVGVCRSCVDEGERRREAEWEATEGELPARRITNPIRRGVGANLIGSPQVLRDLLADGLTEGYGGMAAARPSHRLRRLGCLTGAAGW